MAFFNFLIILIAAAIPAFIFTRIYFEPEFKGNFDSFKKDSWFGKEIIKDHEKLPKDDTTLKPFVLNISHNILNDLRQRLLNSRFIDNLPNVGFTYGFNQEYLKEINKYWLEKYDWRKQENYLNKFPQFHTQIEGLNIHFVHVKPKMNDKQKIPILLLNGWPGTYMEYFPLIDELTKSNDFKFNFEIIIPSIPGYGWSEAPHQVGFNGPAAARIFNKLMERIGHKKYVVHGSDWGSLIAKCLTALYPENTRALHLVQDMYMPKSAYDYVRMLLAYLFPKQFFGGENYQEEWDKLFPISKKFKFLIHESGYMHIQATKPDTIGSALMDTPIGLAAYILEKYATWTDPNHTDRNDGGLGMGKYTIDQLLTTVMIYWTNGNIASSQRFYYENLQNFDISSQFSKVKCKIPTGIVDTKFDLTRTVEKFSKTKYPNLIHFTSMDGGHFLALERPKEFSKELKDFILKVIEFEKKNDKQNLNKKKHDEI